MSTTPRNGRKNTAAFGWNSCSTAAAASNTRQNNGGTDPVLAEFQKEDPETKKPYADSFGWLSHTYDTPYLDVGCATQNYIEAELNENTNWAAAAPGTTPGTGGLGLTESTEPTRGARSREPEGVRPGQPLGLRGPRAGQPGDGR